MGYRSLREYVVKGFVLDDDRLKQGEQIFGHDFFQELLERVRSIRASERRMYLKITDIFAEYSTDYDKNSPITQDFFATVQNKFHYAIVGQTAAEVVHSHADRARENMGLTTWKNSPGGRIVQGDVIVAKNYLKEEEIKKLERTISGFFCSDFKYFYRSLFMYGFTRVLFLTFSIIGDKRWAGIIPLFSCA